jgi:hypothetical protein
MPITNLPKYVRFFPDERLELLDIQALQNLGRDLVSTVTTCTMGLNPSEEGWVLQGFTYALPGGLVFQMDTSLGIGINNLGRVIIKPTTQSVDLTLTAGVTNYIYAYAVDAGDILDNRRKWDRGIGAEVAINDFTRYTPVVGFHVDTSPIITSLSVLGETVPLIKLYSVDLTGGGPITSLLVTDDRNMLRPVNEIDEEVIAARQPFPSLSLTAKVDLKTQIESARPADITVGFFPGSQGDYVNAAGMQDVIDATYHDISNKKIFIHSGAYTGLSGATITSKESTLFEGVPTSSTTLGGSRLEFLPAAINLVFDSCEGITFRNLTFATSAGLGTFALVLEDCFNIRFENCFFTNPADKVHPLIKFKSTCYGIYFTDCHFENYVSTPTYGMIETDSTTNTAVNTALSFENCRIYSEGTFLRSTSTALVTGEIELLSIQNCNFETVENSGTAVYDLIDINMAGSTGDTCTLINNNKFKDGADNDYLLNFLNIQSALSTSATPVDTTLKNTIMINDNYFLDFGGVSVAANTSPRGAITVGNWKDPVSVTNNVFSTDKTFPVVGFNELWGVKQIHYGAHTACRGGTISGNSFDFAGEGSGIYITNHDLVTVGTKGLLGLLLNGNTIKNLNRGIYINTSAGYGGLGICDNSILDAKISAIDLVVTVSTFSDDVSISNNQILGGGTVAGSTVVFGNGISAVCAAINLTGADVDFKNLTLSNNMIKDWAIALTSTAVQGILVHAGIQGSVSGNQISNLGVDNSVAITAANQKASGGIILVNREGYEQSLSVCNNNINYSGAGSGIYIDPSISPGVVGFESIILNSNTVLNSCTTNMVIGGITIGGCFTASWTADGVTRLVCSSNTVRLSNLANGTLLYSQSGIEFQEPSTGITPISFNADMIINNNVVEVVNSVGAPHMKGISAEANNIVASANLTRTSDPLTAINITVVGSSKTDGDNLNYT